MPDTAGGFTQDDFLDGALNIRQPAKGYRAGIDPVLLAAAVSARPGQTVLELGCGVGVASLCLAKRVGNLQCSGVELQEQYAELARENAKTNGFDMAIYCADIADLPAALRQQSFDHVFANPPFFDRSRGTGAEDAGRDLGRGGQTPIHAWVDVAARRAGPRGTVTMIHRAESLPAILLAMQGRLGSILVKPIAPRVGRQAGLVIVQARKSGRAAFKLLPPLILHEGALHTRDEDSYTPEVYAILRNGAPLPMA